MKQFIIFFLIGCTSFILVSCGGDNEVSQEKKEFIIDTQLFGEFGNTHTIEKTGRLSSEQSITLNSKVLGEISSIAVKSGDSVVKGQPLIYVRDSVSNYQGNLNAASLAVESAKINYETQKINLEKAVSDAELNLERTKRNYEISKAQIEQDMKQAEINFQNSNLSSTGSSSSLELQRIQENIAKAEFDYENLLVSNDQQIESFIESSKNEYNTLVNLYIDIIDFGDTILGITPENRRENDDFEDFLGAGDNVSLQNSKNLFRSMQVAQTNLEAINDSDISEKNLLSFLDAFRDNHDILQEFLQSLEKTLIGSIDSSNFPKDSFISQTNAFQSQVSGAKSGFTATRNTISTFLNTYTLNEASSQKQIELLYTDLEIAEKSFGDGEDFGEINYRKTILALEDQLSALNTGLKNAQTTYDNAKKQLDVTLRALNNQIKTAQNSYANALKEYQKLTITSPIDGVVGEISVQVGQEISQGTRLVSLSNVSRGEVKVFFSEEEFELVSEDQSVMIRLGWDEISGTLSAISRIANSSLNYEGSIIFDEEVDAFGGILQVNIPITTQYPLIPISLVETTGDQTGQIKLFVEDQIQNRIIGIGKIWGNMVEVTSGVQVDETLITSNVSNFDAQTFTLQTKSGTGGTQ